tara:strand:+ start:298 stop:873 length:576 start_codon:yes stop_codon:yes gene_type:complete
MPELSPEMISAISAVIGSARRVVTVGLKKGMPVEGLQGSLMRLDAVLKPCTECVRPPARVEGSDVPGVSKRLYRVDMVPGGHYILNRGDGVSMPFEFKGDCEADRPAPSMETSSFWAVIHRTDAFGEPEEDQKCYFTDFGLEPYRKHSRNPRWHLTNSVSSLPRDDVGIDALLDSLAEDAWVPVEDDDIVE